MQELVRIILREGSDKRKSIKFQGQESDILTTICIVLCNIEASYDLKDRPEFRSNFLRTLNDSRNYFFEKHK